MRNNLNLELSMLRTLRGASLAAVFLSGTATAGAGMGESLTFFGQTMTRRSMWVMTNGVVPPWSK